MIWRGLAERWRRDSFSREDQIARQSLQLMRQDLDDETRCQREAPVVEEFLPAF